MRVMFAGGGTGGHIFPAVAVLQALRERAGDVEALFVLGGSRGSALLGKYDLPWRSIPVRGMPRKSAAALPLFYARLALSVILSLLILLRRRPDVVMAVGGYASTPVAFAAYLLRIPVVAAEQNAVAGVATRWNARFAQSVFLSFEESRKGLPARGRMLVTGNPIRNEISQGDRDRACRRWGLDPARRTLLVVGGSQGARAMNAIVREALERWDGAEGVQVLFQTGAADFEAIRESCSRIAALVRPFPFLGEMGDAYGVADLVVCRAGASTLAEITALGIPSILIPFPWAAEKHQSKNARLLAERGAAVYHEEKDLTAEVLLGEIRGLLEDETRRADMGRKAKAIGRPEAAKEIAEEIFRIAKKGDVRGNGGAPRKMAGESDGTE